MNGRIPGAVAVVALGGHVELFEALGQRDAAAGTPMAADAIFRIYSMTKPLVSLAALMLAEEGRLQLGDPVSRYLPEFAGQQVAVEEGGAVRLEPARREPTVHDLLRHTAGLTYEFLGSNAVQRQYEAAHIANRSRSNAEFCKVLAALPLAHQPGSCWEYSRATDVLGALLEVVTGQPLGALLARAHPGSAGHEGHRVCGASARAGIASPSPSRPTPTAASRSRMLDGETAAARSNRAAAVCCRRRGDYVRFLQLMRNRGTLDGCRLVSRTTIDWMTVRPPRRHPDAGRPAAAGLWLRAGLCGAHATRLRAAARLAGPVFLERHRRHVLLRRPGAKTCSRCC